MTPTVDSTYNDSNCDSYLPSFAVRSGLFRDLHGATQGVDGDTEQHNVQADNHQYGHGEVVQHGLLAVDEAVEGVLWNAIRNEMNLCYLNLIKKYIL